MKGKWGRYLKGAVFGKLGFCTSWAVDVHDGGEEWIEVVEVDLEIDGLGDSFHGKRIIHISDLHCSRTVSSKYLGHCIDRINVLDGDIVVLTGDYITSDYHGRFREKVVDLVSGIESKYGVYACLGNHDYGDGGLCGARRDRGMEEMVEGFEAGGVNVLRNDRHVLEIDGDELSLVGLGDIWAGDFEPEKAFDGADHNGSVIALAHNPKALKYLKNFCVDAVMCGHTHGIGVEWATSTAQPIVNRRKHFSGMYNVGGKKLYVNRGLGRLGKLMFNVRPEITVYSLC